MLADDILKYNNKRNVRKSSKLWNSCARSSRASCYNEKLVCLNDKSLPERLRKISWYDVRVDVNETTTWWTVLVWKQRQWWRGFSLFLEEWWQKVLQRYNFLESFVRSTLGTYLNIFMEYNSKLSMDHPQQWPSRTTKKQGIDQIERNHDWTLFRRINS